MTEAGSNEGTEAALDALGAELTTPLVADVLHRLRYEEELIFWFFACASHQDGYEHEPATYNDVIDILSSMRYKARQFGVLCDVLDHMKRHGTRSLPVEDLLGILRIYTERHLTHLRKLAKKRGVRMRKQPETDALNVLLDGFCKCGMVMEARAVFGRVKRRLLGNVETYNILFRWCRARDPKKSHKRGRQRSHARGLWNKWLLRCSRRIGDEDQRLLRLLSEIEKDGEEKKEFLC